MPATKAEVAEIVASERLRVAGILESAEGRLHPKTAINFALYTSMTVEQANNMMTSIPIESLFLESMEREGPVGVRQSSPGPAGTSLPEDAKAARLVEIKAGSDAYNRAKGYRGQA